MFNDVFNIKETSLENTDFFKGVNRWFWLEKKNKFFLYMYLLKIRLKTESSAFIDFPWAVLKQRTVFVLHFSK